MLHFPLSVFLIHQNVITYSREISDAQISYSLLEDRSGDHKYFSIDPELGLIYTQSVFDRETKSSYLLEVQSMDGWESARPGRHGQRNSGKHSLAWCFIAAVLIPCCFFTCISTCHISVLPFCVIIIIIIIIFPNNPKPFLTS